MPLLSRGKFDQDVQQKAVFYCQFKISISLNDLVTEP